MGRIFETRKATMFARWDRMSKAFTRVGKEIAIAVRQGGPIPENNPALRRAIQNARSVNMPKDKVETAIKKASGQGAEDYEELLYEGYAPHGVALLIETATDNPTRTVANIRMHFNKCSGNLGATGSVSFQFEHHGVFEIKAEGVDAEELELELIDFGCEGIEAKESEKHGEVLELRCGFVDFGTMQRAVEERGLEIVSSTGDYVPQNLIELDEEQETDVLKLVDRLEQDDDVQKVHHNLA
jgi:YebC/PmpR family DNA-binding regulatory protein